MRKCCFCGVNPESVWQVDDGKFCCSDDVGCRERLIQRLKKAESELECLQKVRGMTKYLASFDYFASDGKITSKDRTPHERLHRKRMRKNIGEAK